MDYKSILEGLEGFWNTSAMFSKHQVGAWKILYTLILEIAHFCEEGALFTLSQF